MIVYLDKEFRCRIRDGGGFERTEVKALDGLCEAVAEGMRFVPRGRVWIAGDGSSFRGEMLAPAEDSRILAARQEQYELGLRDMAGLIEEIYQKDLEVIG